ncbi:MAG: SPASM domain-containing protein, partial [Candidatus Omnitrophica bacterium]|nr:SPASM domain-containing protein [Candidatus Omnitrophota bacterium]
HGFSRVIIERFIPWGYSQRWKDKVVTLGTWKKTALFLLRTCNLEEDLSLLFPYRAFMVAKKRSELSLKAASCILGKDGLALMPDGTVYPCRRFPLPLGNLTSQSLEEIWENSPVLNILRQRGFLKGKCANCPITECLGCRALAYSLTGGFLNEDPLCFLRD